MWNLKFKLWIAYYIHLSNRLFNIFYIPLDQPKAFHPEIGWSYNLLQPQRCDLRCHGSLQLWQYSQVLREAIAVSNDQLSLVIQPKGCWACLGFHFKPGGEEAKKAASRSFSNNIYQDCHKGSYLSQTLKKCAPLKFGLFEKHTKFEKIFLMVLTFT